MKEIGGYFELDKTTKNNGVEFYSDLLALNCARNAFLYLCRARNIKKIYIPFFLCDSISKVCQKEGVAFEYYHTSESFKPIFNKRLNNNEYLYIVNYFGQMTREEIVLLKNKYKTIIIDNVQAFFDKPVDGIDTIYSCRKFFGVPDGAYLSTNAGHLELQYDDSSRRLSHIIGRTKDGAKKHYQEYLSNEELLSKAPLCFMSKTTHSLLGKIDYSCVASIRESNFAFLHSKLGHLNMLSVRCPIGPYSYPLHIKNGSQIRDSLIKKNIFIPHLWPNILSKKEDAFSRDILPLPCDQRYTKDDMEYIANEVLKCLN